MSGFRRSDCQTDLLQWIRGGVLLGLVAALSLTSCDQVGDDGLIEDGIILTGSAVYPDGSAASGLMVRLVDYEPDYCLDIWFCGEGITGEDGSFRLEYTEGDRRFRVGDSIRVEVSDHWSCPLDNACRDCYGLTPLQLDGSREVEATVEVTCPG